MIDNLQLHYLSRLELALEMFSHGNPVGCLEICYDLRLRTDLAFYTRAVVNLTLADITNFKDHPRRADFAKEALRLATELDEQNDQGRDSFWTAEYARLKQAATVAVNKIEMEERAWEEEHQELEQRPPLADDQELVELELEQGDDVATTDWDVEGAFSVNLVSTQADETSMLSMIDQFPQLQVSETHEVSETNKNVEQSEEPALTKSPISQK